MYLLKRLRFKQSYIIFLYFIKTKKKKLKTVKIINFWIYNKIVVIILL